MFKFKSNFITNTNWLAVELKLKITVRTGVVLILCQPRRRQYTDPKKKKKKKNIVKTNLEIILKICIDRLASARCAWRKAWALRWLLLERCSSDKWTFSSNPSPPSRLPFPTKAADCSDEAERDPCKWPCSTAPCTRPEVLNPTEWWKCGVFPAGDGAEVDNKGRVEPPKWSAKLAKNLSLMESAMAVRIPCNVACHAATHNKVRTQISSQELYWVQGKSVHAPSSLRVMSSFNCALIKDISRSCQKHKHNI